MCVLEYVCASMSVCEITAQVVEVPCVTVYVCVCACVCVCVCVCEGLVWR